MDLNLTNIASLIISVVVGIISSIFTLIRKVDDYHNEANNSIHDEFDAAFLRYGQNIRTSSDELLSDISKKLRELLLNAFNDVNKLNQIDKFISRILFIIFALIFIAIILIVITFTTNLSITLNIIFLIISLLLILSQFYIVIRIFYYERYLKRLKSKYQNFSAKI